MGFIQVLRSLKKWQALQKLKKILAFFLTIYFSQLNT